jgi:hypothetical protein
MILKHHVFTLAALKMAWRSTAKSMTYIMYWEFILIRWLKIENLADLK